MILITLSALFFHLEYGLLEEGGDTNPRGQFTRVGIDPTSPAGGH